jgi:hypothetical protein
MHKHQRTWEGPLEAREHLGDGLVPCHHEPESVHLLQHGAAAGLLVGCECVRVCVRVGVF